jgi:hypothetical protein
VQILTHISIRSDNLKGKVEVFLELEEVAEIEKQAKEKDISRSAWIRAAVSEKLDRESNSVFDTLSRL